MTDIVPFKGAGGGLISREDLAKALENASMSMPTIGGDYQYLKMDREGVWLYGQEEVVVEDDSLWAVNPLSLMHGYVAWDSNAGSAPPVQEVMMPINRTLPPESALPPLGIGSPDKKTGERKQLTYQPQRSVDLVCISGEDEGTVVQYKQSSGGAMKLFTKLTNDLMARLQKDPDSIVQIVKLKSESYKNKTYGGRTYNPIFELVEWRSMDNTAPADGADDAPQQEPEQEQPAPRQRTRTAAPQQEPEPEASTEEDEALAAEYAAEQAKAEQAAPRRRVRR